MDIDAAVVLAAGEGNRLRPLTRNRPKPMLPAGNRPILEHVFDALIEADIEELHVVVGYKHDRVQDHFGPKYRDVSLQYHQQDKQLGSGHALLQARKDIDEAFLVVNGDQIAGPEIINEVLKEHAAHDDSDDVLGSLALLSSTDVVDYGGVRVEDDHVAEIVERPGEHGAYRLNAGVYAFEPRIFEYIAESEPIDGEVSLTDVLARLIEEEDAVVRGIVTRGLWVDATYPWDLLTMARELSRHGIIGGEAGTVHVDETASVHETAVLRGPVAISADCQIGPGVVLGPETCLGQNVTVEANSVVEGSVLDTDTRVGPNSTLIDCVTGQGVHVGPSNTVEGGEADIRVDNQVFERRTLGAMLADRVETAGDVSFEPGTLVGPEAELGTGVTVSGTVDADAHVIR